LHPKRLNFRFDAAHLAHDHFKLNQLEPSIKVLTI